MFDREDEMIGRVVESLRTPAAPDAAADARIMAAVRAEAAAQRAPAALRVVRGGWRWLREPRSVAITPLAAGALAAGLVLAAFGVARMSAGRDRAVVAAAPAPAAARTDTVVVQFVLVAPGARSVTLVGDFNGWDSSATPLSGSSSGLWSVALPLRPGRHQYAFVVDGARWVADPAAPRALGDDFGAPSSVVTVGEHST